MPDMTKRCPFDVFLIHISNDKAVVPELADRLPKNGLKVWGDDWEMKPGDGIPAKIEEGPEYSRVHGLGMSANAFDSAWAQLEAGAFRIRDPLNRERRCISLRLDDATIKGCVAQFLYTNWLLKDRGHAADLESRFAVLRRTDDRSCNRKPRYTL